MVMIPLVLPQSMIGQRASVKRPRHRECRRYPAPDRLRDDEQVELGLHAPDAVDGVLHIGGRNPLGVASNLPCALPTQPRLGLSRGTYPGSAP